MPYTAFDRFLARRRFCAAITYIRAGTRTPAMTDLHDAPQAIEIGEALAKATSRRDPRYLDTLAAAYAGAAGALLAQTTAFVSLDVFEFHRSADVLLVLIIGGAGWLYGGIAGAVIYKLLQDGIATLTPQYWQFWIGLLLVAFVMVGRQRFVGGLYGLLALARRR